MTVYHIIFIIVITTKMIYAPTLIILMYESFYLMKRCFCYPILKATCFVTTGHDEVKTWRQDDACIVKRNIQSLIYHPEFFVPFTKQLNWHYISWHIICSHFIENLNILLHALRPLKKKKSDNAVNSFLPYIYRFYFQNAKTTPPPQM